MMTVIKTEQEILDEVARTYSHTNCTIENWNQFIKNYHPNYVHNAIFKAMQLFAEQHEKSTKEDILDKKKISKLIKANMSNVIDNMVHLYLVERKIYENNKELDAFSDNFEDWFESNYLQ